MFKKEVSGSMDLQALAARTAKAIEARSKIVSERQNQFNAAAKRVLADLDDV